MLWIWPLPVTAFSHCDLQMVCKNSSHVTARFCWTNSLMWSTLQASAWWLQQLTQPVVRTWMNVWCWPFHKKPLVKPSKHRWCNSAWTFQQMPKWLQKVLTVPTHPPITNQPLSRFMTMAATVIWRPFIMSKRPMRTKTVRLTNGKPMCLWARMRLKLPWCNRPTPMVKNCTSINTVKFNLTA